MQLDNITIAVRPRSNGEAMDLGLRLVQTHSRALYGPWFAILLPLFLVLNIFLSEHLWLAVAIVWWLKPLYDRILLHVLSRALFGQTPTTRETLNSLRGALSNGLIAQLTYLRLSPRRSFLLPVWQLEDLRGTARRERVRVLTGSASTQAVWLTIVCVHIETSIVLGLYGLIYIFLPQDTEISALAPFFSEAPPYWIELTSNFLYLLAIAAVEPFYVAAGFMLYIQRRTQLEAWDIEIRFRRLAQRLGAAGATAALLLVAVFILGPVDSAYAQPTAQTPPTADESKRAIDEILAHEDFSINKTVTTWLPDWQWDNKRKKDKTDLSAFATLQKIVAGGLKLILIILVVGIVLYLIINRRLWLDAYTRKKPGTIETPTVLFGMDIQPESLPDNVAEAARSLWQQGRQRESLSLLYRGSLSHLVNHDALMLNSAMTESDIVTCARSANIPSMRVEYLSGLTHIWKTLAYGHHQPGDDQVQHLFSNWAQHFARPGPA